MQQQHLVILNPADPKITEALLGRAGLSGWGEVGDNASITFTPIAQNRHYGNEFLGNGDNHQIFY